MLFIVFAYRLVRWDTNYEAVIARGDNVIIIPEITDLFDKTNTRLFAHVSAVAVPSFG